MTSESSEARGTVSGAQPATVGSDEPQGVAAAAGQVTEVAASRASEVKDEALERGSEVVAVAKEELANLTGDFRDQLQKLWDQAGGQLREQANAGQQQAAELLHSLAGELGHLASRSEQDGPLTALARSAAEKGGEWSHWLANTDPSDVVAQVRRFARRRPLAFLTGAAIAGVLVGRLSRGLMASSAATAPTAATRTSPASAAPVRAAERDVTAPAPGTAWAESGLGQETATLAASPAPGTIVDAPTGTPPGRAAEELR